ncbi:MAG: DUF4291 domain-containing protein [Myxococcales bacterium]|nr:DUF4291 domain-containing protein [Myxococcales bacterium]
MPTVEGREPPLARHEDQVARWPAEGRVILASFDAETVVVYQAYREEIAAWALAHGRFGGPWSRDRMSWVKPGFLWMMYRSGWGTKHDQERVLGVRLERAFFDDVLARAVPTGFDPAVYPDRESWQAAGSATDVRVQWDPDHAPDGSPVARRAIQLGLRGATLGRYADQAIVAIHPMDAVVARGRDAAPDALVTPLERPYPVADAAVRRRLRVDVPAETVPAEEIAP